MHGVRDCVLSHFSGVNFCCRYRASIQLCDISIVTHPHHLTNLARERSSEDSKYRRILTRQRTPGMKRRHVTTHITMVWTGSASCTRKNGSQHTNPHTSLRYIWKASHLPLPEVCVRCVALFMLSSRRLPLVTWARLLRCETVSCVVSSAIL